MKSFISIIFALSASLSIVSADAKPCPHNNHTVIITFSGAGGSFYRKNIPLCDTFFTQNDMIISGVTFDGRNICSFYSGSAKDSLDSVLLYSGAGDGIIAPPQRVDYFDCFNHVLNTESRLPYLIKRTMP